MSNNNHNNVITATFSEDDSNNLDRNSQNLSEYQDVLSFLENNLDDTEKKQHKWLKYPKAFIAIFATPPSEYHGTAIVTRGVKAEAKKLSTVNAGSNIIDFALNWPLFYFLFSNFGSVVAFPASFVVNLLLLRTANAAAAGVPTSLQKNKDWSKAAMIALIAMNILQTAFSAVGSEAFNNQPELEENRAEELIFDRQDEIDKLATEVSPLLKNVQAQCLEGQQILERTPRSNPFYDTTYINIYGSYAERNRDWSNEPYSKWPRCVLKRHLKQEQSIRYELVKAQFLDNQRKYGNNKVFLREEYPDIYAEAFTTEGELASGVDLIRLALVNLLAKIKSGQIASLGLTLILLSISIVTSAISIKMTLAYVKRDDVQMSYDETIRVKRDEWLERLRQEMNRDHDQQLRRLEADYDS